MKKFIKRFLKVVGTKLFTFCATKRQQITPEISNSQNETNQFTTEISNNYLFFQNNEANQCKVCGVNFCMKTHIVC